MSWMSIPGICLCVPIQSGDGGCWSVTDLSGGLSSIIQPFTSRYQIYHQYSDENIILGLFDSTDVLMVCPLHSCGSRSTVLWIKLALLINPSHTGERHRYSSFTSFEWGQSFVCLCVGCMSMCSPNVPVQTCTIDLPDFFFVHTSFSPVSSQTHIWTCFLCEALLFFKKGHWKTGVV